MAWNSKRNWGKFHFIVIALCLPSFSFPHWSGCFAERSSLGSARRGLPRSCPAFCWPGTFPGPFQDSPSRKQLLCPWLCPQLAQQRAGHRDSRGAGEGEPVCDATWTERSARSVAVSPTARFLWKNSLSKRSTCLLWKMGGRRQVRPEVCVLAAAVEEEMLLKALELHSV